jgi:hypothetical protein
MLAALDEGDTAEMYLGVIQSQIDIVRSRHDQMRARESLKLDPEVAMALEETLLQTMQENSNLREHLQSVRYRVNYFIFRGNLCACKISKIWLGLHDTLEISSYFRDRSLHDAWRENADIRNPCKFPVVVAGTQVQSQSCLLSLAGKLTRQLQVAAMERMHVVAQAGKFHCFFLKFC